MLLLEPFFIFMTMPYLFALILIQSRKNTLLDRTKTALIFYVPAYITCVLLIQFYFFHGFYVWLMMYMATIYLIIPFGLFFMFLLLLKELAEYSNNDFQVAVSEKIVFTGLTIFWIADVYYIATELWFG